ELPDASATAATPKCAARAPMTCCRVLLIEDNVDAADTLRLALELQGHVVEVAHDGRAGLAEARRFAPDAILCDIGLPEMDGYQVAAALRTDGQLGSTWLVALTGYALPEDVKRCHAAGFDRPLAKPCDPRQVQEVLAEVGP